MADHDDIAKDVFSPEMQRTTSRTKLCLEELAARLVGHTFKIPDGFADWIDCKVKLFQEANDSRVSVDVVMSDGAHLELTITRTGWGSPVARPYGPGKEPHRGL